MNTIIYGDCRETLRNLALIGTQVQTCVTSPPYFGLRDYGHEGQLGLEETPEQYIQNMVEVFRCVRDVLADDGTLWVNIGDSYHNYRPGNYSDNRAHAFGGERKHDRHLPDEPSKSKRGRKLEGIKEKDLIGIPWMLAFALRADGWYLRQDIIWHKPNPMPESVRDRCTKAHEYIFLFSKSDRYFFDSEAIKEQAASTKPAGNKTHKYANAYAAGNSEEHRTKAGLVALAGVNWETRNRRSVWTVATRPYKGAHFATFPPDLIEPCILAGSRCGDIVLDPFMGSGTTAAVAIELGRQFIGCELNPAYAPLAEDRIAKAKEFALV